MFNFAANQTKLARAIQLVGRDEEAVKAKYIELGGYCYPDEVIIDENIQPGELATESSLEPIVKEKKSKKNAK